MWTRALLLVFAVGCAGIEDVDTIEGRSSDNANVAVAKNALNIASPCQTFSARGRAFGLKLAALGILDIAPSPDTNSMNPTNLARLIVNLPLGVGISLANTLFSVEDVATNDDCMATDIATATTNALSLSLLGLNLSATTLRATASSTASAEGVSASAAGSLVQNLRINGRDYAEVTGPLTITVRAPLLGTPIAEVRVLETIPGNNTANSASLQVNALHVILLDGATDIIVAHAETQAEAHPCGCGS